MKPLPAADHSPQAYRTTVLGHEKQSRMKSKLRTVTLESRFPLLAVEGNMIVSKGGDLTIAYEVALPEVFSLDRADYEALHGA